MKAILVLVAISAIVFANCDICPKYSCGSLSDKLCANETTDKHDDKDYGIVLDQNACKYKTELCDISLHPLNSKGSCVNNTYSSNISTVAFPGEECSATIKCQGGVACPDNKICPGKAQGENCTANLDCSRGLWCQPPANATAYPSSTCAPQLAANSACTTSYACPNNQGCFNKTCQDYYSADGVNFTIVRGEGANAQRYCKNQYAAIIGDASSNEYKCITPTYKKDGKPTNDVFVTCSANSDCNLYDGDNVIDKNRECNCGYNSAGTAYCQVLPNSISKILFLIFRFRCLGNP